MESGTSFLHSRLCLLSSTALTGVRKLRSPHISYTARTVPEGSLCVQNPRIFFGFFVKPMFFGRKEGFCVQTDCQQKQSASESRPGRHAQACLHARGPCRRRVSGARDVRPALTPLAQ